MRNGTHRGFTLIELVIAVAIIGILVAAIVPQFNDVTEHAKVETFRYNCQAVCASLAIYQAGHDGALPADETEFGNVINGGWESLDNSPAGASYTYAGGVFSASYTDGQGTTYSFRYPN